MAPSGQRKGQRVQQIVLEKQTLDVFQTRHADALVNRLGTRPEFVVFGVVTEFCVSCAVKGLLERGRRVAVVTDAIETLKRCCHLFRGINYNRLITNRPPTIKR